MQSSISDTAEATRIPTVPIDAIDPKRLNRVLVIKLRNHGDVLLVTPVLSLLRQALPTAQIDALVYTDTMQMLAGHPALSHLFTVDRDWKQKGKWSKLLSELQLYSALKTQRYDLIIHLTEGWHGAWLTRLLRVPFAVGPKVRNRGRLWNKTFTHFYATPSKANRHMVERNLDALRRIGLRPAAQEPIALTLVPGAVAEEKIKYCLEEFDLQRNEFIVFHPASRWRFKTWPASSCAALIERLHNDGKVVVLTSAPEPGERALIADIQSHLTRPAIDLSGRLSLRELGAIIACARLFIGVDSAPMHMAAALDIPVVALFGPSGETEWAPWCSRYRIVTSSKFTCRPCGLDGCGGGKISECLTSIDDKTVHEAVCSLLGETDPNQT